jgi:hypothetical protein
MLGIVFLPAEFIVGVNPNIDFDSASGWLAF